jgi:hypothetical protein
MIIALVIAISILSVLIPVFVIIPATDAAYYDRCSTWYQNLGIRLTILHTRFNLTMTAAPIAFTAASDDLVNDYREIWEEEIGFNIECAEAGYNIPKFLNQ